MGRGQIKKPLTLGNEDNGFRAEARGSDEALPSDTL